MNSSGDLWVSFTPSASELWEDESDLVMRKAAFIESSRLAGDSALTKQRLTKVMLALQETSQSKKSSHSAALNNINRLTAFRIFSLFPHPEMPAPERNSSELHNFENFPERELYQRAGHWLLARDLDLKLTLGWLQKKSKAYKPFALLAEQRYQTIRGLFEYKQIKTDASIAGTWLASEYSAAVRGYRKIQACGSTNTARTAMEEMLDEMETAVKEGIQPQVPEGVVGAVYCLELFAAKVAASNPDFDREYFSPLVRKTRSWRNGMRSFKKIGAQTKRGARL